MAAAAPTHTPQPRPAAGATALYVGDLDSRVTEQLLWATFADAGLIRNVRICQDAATKRSLCYGYVNFVNAADAERAINTKANVRIMDRPCRVMWSQRDPSLRRSGVGNLFVKNLAPTVDSVKLQSIFSFYGNILSCKVVPDDKGVSKGFGFVHFESSDAATKAVTGLNGTTLDGTTIYVGQHVPKRQRVSPADTKWTNVFVKNLPGDCDEAKLRELFSKYGEITSIYLSKHEFSSKNAATGAEATTRCFGFVNFGNHEEAKAAAEALNEFKLGENTLFVGRAQTRAERASTLARNVKREPVQSNLYIKHLEEGVTKEILEKHFSKFGTISSASIATDANGASRGFGFVCFQTAEAAQKAIADASTHAIPGFTKPLFVGLFEPKNVRGPRISAQKAMEQHPMFFPPQMPYYYQGRPMNQPGARGPRAPHNGPATTARRTQGPAHLAQGGGHAQGGAAHATPAAAAPVATPVAARPSLALPSKAELQAMAPAEAQTAIGDYLFNSMLGPKYANLNGKITGMLLSMHANDLQGLIDLVHNSAELDKHITEAYDILDEQTRTAAQ